MTLNERYTPDGLRNTDALFAPTYSINKSERLTVPLTPGLVDTTLMQPQMILCPADLSGFRDQNLQVQLTPERWGLFSVADGNTTLQMACQQLMISREQVCQVAGELVALNLISLRLPDSGLLLDSSLAYNNVFQTQLSQNSFTSPPIETHSQWGNGATGATFVLGNGWVVASSTSQSQLSSDANSDRTMDYATAGGM
jgi:hypothetical protein